jgi:hypothetical protein
MLTCLLIYRFIQPIYYLAVVYMRLTWQNLINKAC